jgi:hypothetical protein
MERARARRTRISRVLPLRWVAALLLIGAPLSFPEAGAVFTAATADTGNSVAAGVVAAPTSFSTTQTCTTPTIAFRAAAPPGRTVGGSPLTLALPAGTQAGDILIAHITNRYDGSSGLNPPSTAWALIGNRTTYGQGQAGVTGAVYWKVATASEPSSFTFSMGSGTADMAGGLLAYSGVHPTTPVDAVAIATNSGPTVVTPPVTTTVANTLLVHAITKEAEMSPVPTGSTQRSRILSVSSSSNQGSTIGDEPIAASGAVSYRTAIGTADTNWIVHSFALKPAPRIPSASLTWTSSSTTGASGYNLERVVGGSATRQWTVTPITATSSTDPSLTNGTTYTYRLRAYRGSWVSAWVTASLTPSC